MWWCKPLIQAPEKQKQACKSNSKSFLTPILLPNKDIKTWYFYYYQAAGIKLGKFWAILTRLGCCYQAICPIICRLILPWLSLVHVGPHGCSLIKTSWGIVLHPHGLSISSSLLVSSGPSDWEQKSYSVFFCPANWLISSLTNQEVMENNFYITLRQCLDCNQISEISSWIHNAYNHPQHRQRSLWALG